MWMVIVAMLVGCGGSPIAQPVADEIGEGLLGVAHPNATFVSATVVNHQNGGGIGDIVGGEKSHDRYVDIDVKYQRKKKDAPQNSMLLRVYLLSPAPCKIDVDVLSDDGPSPVLLDNSLVGRVAGEQICGAFAP